MSNSKPIVFFIMPFEDIFFSVFNDLKSYFCNKFDFTHAGDLDTQNCIIKDIVLGINNADIIIADLTGLNANVFYELGIAHGLRKKSIIITQDIDELPFDIKSYRAVGYSVVFDKYPKLKETLEDLLDGMTKGTTPFGNPVSDYIIGDYNHESPSNGIKETTETDTKTENNDQEESGFLDNIDDMNEQADRLSSEMSLVQSDMNKLQHEVLSATDKINANKNSNSSVSYTRNICRNLAKPVAAFADSLAERTEKMLDYWNGIENNFLSLLDNPLILQPRNYKDVKNSSSVLEELKDVIIKSDTEMDGFKNAMISVKGVERRLNSALNKSVDSIDKFLSFTSVIQASVDRIQSRISLLEEKSE